MRHNLKWILGIVICMAVAAGSYLMATGMMASIYAYRSPLSSSPPEPGEAVGEPLSNRVVFILIDALRMDTAYDAQVMPYLNELRQQGAWAEMHSREPSYSAAGYSVIFTGAWPELSDGPVFNLETEDIPAWTQDNLFSAAHRAGLQTAVSGYEWFEKLIPVGAVTSGFFTPGEDWFADREVVDAALPWLQSGEYQLVLIHLDQVDYAGHHEGGPRDPNWDTAATRVDDLIKEIVANIDLSFDTLFICSDHGQVDAGGHGGSEQVVLQEPFVLVGAGVRPGAYQAVQMVDIAPTLAVILGLNLPASTQGQVQTEMLTLTTESLMVLEAAQAAQQTKLAAIYEAAIEIKVENVQSGLVKDIQRAMDAAWQEQVKAERLPRFLLAGMLAAIPLAMMIWRRSRLLTWMIAGALLYQLVFNLVYAGLKGMDYTFSYVAGPTELVIDGLVNTFLAFAVGWVLAVFGSKILNKSGPEAAAFSFGLVLVTLYSLALPVLWSYAWDGLFVGRFLPDFNRSFVALLAMVQGLAVGLWGLPFAGLAALLAAVRGRKR